MPEGIDLRKLAILSRVFTPSAPVQDRKIFAGRQEQLTACLEVIFQPGAHAILYGERGVGKTSVANIIRLILDSQGILVVKRSCDSQDTLESIWKKVFSCIPIAQEFARPIGFTGNIAIQTEEVPLSSLLSETELAYTPQTVLESLEDAPQPLVIILDEFDRLGEGFDYQIFADILKTLSDDLPDITLMIVGVGDTITDLIREHASLERNLKQISLPVMTGDELSAILENGLSELGMTMEPAVINKIIEYSCGYPHYIHLLAYHSCKAALSHNVTRVTASHLGIAIRKSIAESHESLRQAYQKATLATKHNIYKEVLWACAITPMDENGTFQAKDLEGPLSSILGNQVNVTEFTYHLSKLCGNERGNILIPLGVQQRHRYKFRDPLMTAFVRLSMHAQGN